MQIAVPANLACPIDGLALEPYAGGVRCGRGHSYDRAREGYCNLLVVQHKASRDPGDSREMVAARRRFLEAGHYAPIADAVFAHVLLGGLVQIEDCSPEMPFNILDAGCGEGYYLDRLSALANACLDPGILTLAGIDVSKWAVRAAARRACPVTWLVANNRHPPFAPASVDIILCLFGFPVWEGFRAVLRPGGHVLLVDPGPDHLIELREIIYPQVTRSVPASLAAAEGAGYQCVQATTLRFPVSLTSPQSITDLLAMTPHAHRLSQTGRDALARQQTLTVTADVCIRVLALGR